MRQNITAICTLGLLLASVAILKTTLFTSLSKQAAFAVWSLLWIGSFVLLVLLANTAWKWRSSAKRPATRPDSLCWPNRRECYRITYPPALRPTLILTTADGNSTRGLEYMVLDLSEGGFSFLDDGSLVARKKIGGRLLFKRGDSIRITGRIVRRDGTQVSVQLKHPIEYRLILHQQRQVISSAKSDEIV